MHNKRLITFVLISVAAGLLGALVVKLFINDSPIVPHAITPQGGPVSYADAVQRTAPSVVNIYTTKVTIERSNSLFNDPFFQRFFGNQFNGKPRKKLQSSLGSGVIISDEGYILTNHHVINGADKIRVVLSNGRNLDVTVAGTDPDTDIAVLKTNAEDLPVIAIGSANSLRVGDVVLAIGNPYGVGQTVTMGIVSATGRSQLGINTYENFIQTDAAINPGNSGGALINARGELVGINTAIFSKSGGSQGIGFAIPTSLAKGVMDQILKHGRVIRGWLGVAGQDVTPALAESFDLPESNGVLITSVLEGGPADNAGIKPGDVITQIDDHIPANTQEILEIIATIAPGASTHIVGWRGKEPLELDAVISERPLEQRSN